MTEQEIHIVALYRLSKEVRTKDGKTVSRGLSIEAQQSSVQDFAALRRMAIEREFVETISGRRKERPILEEALDYCKKHKCVLVIARLDRLSRRVALISALLESKVRFRVVQFPDIDPQENPFFFQVLSAVSELEVKFIRERTRAALQAKKARGEPLGSFGREVLSKLNHDRADAFARSLIPSIEKLQSKGITSVRCIAKALNRHKIPTYRNSGKWHPTTVSHLLHRIDALPSVINNHP